MRAVWQTHSSLGVVQQTQITGPPGKFCGLTKNAKHAKQQHQNYAVPRATVEALEVL